MNSIYIQDLIKILNSKARIKIVGKRPGEKIHETLFTGQESNLIYEQKDLYLIYPENIISGKKVGKKLSGEFNYVSNSKESLNVSRIKKLIIESKVLLSN
jgi:UDP-N-acetylglucosamine 4,6-dehydratase